MLSGFVSLKHQEIFNKIQLNLPWLSVLKFSIVVFFQHRPHGDHGPGGGTLQDVQDGGGHGPHRQVHHPHHHPHHERLRSQVCSRDQELHRWQWRRKDFQEGVCQQRHGE